MTTFEILLIIIGLILFVGSFFVSEKITVTKDQLKATIDESEVKKLIRLQINNMDDEIIQAVIENIESSSDEIKRSMEKLSNEKIMAIDEYSNTVIEEIHKSHNEVMFLYGMLTDKNKEVKETADLISKANKGINKKFSEATNLIEKMDSQISTMSQYFEKQATSIDQIEKSTQAIENLEKQINKIEQMAIQFSNDMKEEKTHYVEKDYMKDDIYSDTFTKSIGSEKNQVEESTNHYEETTNENDSMQLETWIEELANKSVENEQEDTYKDASNYNQKILEMSKEGENPLEIAKALGLGVGEVKFVIDLFEGGKR